MRHTRRLTARQLAGVLLLATAAATGLSACAPAGQQSQQQVLPPVIADLTSIDGTTVTVAVDGVVDLVGDDENYTAWSAEIDDPAIVAFTEGKDDGGASFNPGLEALAAGETAVTLSNSATDETVSFTVDVTPAG